MSLFSVLITVSIEKKRERRQLSLEQQNQKHLLQLSTGFWPYILYYSPHFILTLLLKLKVCCSSSNGFPSICCVTIQDLCCL
uniref:Uncharacterized protein n=1 Tax=Salix viminalis TaxID=40686 RepID=A0A6N2MP33_SALVM